MDKVIHIEYLRSIILGVCNLNSNPEFYLKCRHHLLRVNNIKRMGGGNEEPTQARQGQHSLNLAKLL